jgi:hypothetical protein
MKTVLIGLVLAATACASGNEPTNSRLGDEAGFSGPGADGDGPPPGGVDENFNCRGTAEGSFDNVFVPAGATCRLENSTVSGNVLAREGARLHVVNTVVDGNIDGVEARAVVVEGGRLGGSIQIADGDSPGELGAAVIGGTVLTQGNIQVIKMRTGRILITDVRLEQGNIKVEENLVGDGLEVRNNDVAQNLQVFKNGGTGPKEVRDNRVRQIAQCKENSAPFTGGPNDAAEAEDQCF